jgi:hypothetical protein
MSGLVNCDVCDWAGTHTYREFSPVAIVLYQFDTVQIEYTTVIPSDDLRLFNPLSAFA